MGGFVLSVLAAATTPAVATPALPAVLTVQALFDRAAAAAEAGHLAPALADYDALERRVAKSKRSLAVVRVRRADVLASLGRDEEAAEALRLGLADLPAGDASLAGDRYLAMFNLGGISERAFDFSAARAAYAVAIPLASVVEARWSAEAALVRVTMFDAAPAAVALAKRVVAGVAADPSIKPDVRAQYRTILGRALLNAGDFAAARGELKTALTELGGLTMKVDLADVAARSDLAIAALLANDAEDARKLLAYTGAGHLKDGFPRASEMEPPSCGGEGDVRPDDVAVVEFAIGDDGTVLRAVPIHVSRQGPAAQAFARAVSGWAWTAEEAKTIEPFYRAAMRVEMRCSTVAERPGIRALLMQAAMPWLLSQGAAEAPEGASGRARLEALRAELRRREASAGMDSPALLPVLIDIAGDRGAGAEESELAATRALAIAERAKAPAALSAIILIDRSNASGAATRASYRRQLDRQLAGLPAIRARPAIATDPVARAAMSIYEADILAELKRRAEGLALLQTVAADERLAGTDAFKVGALVRIASIEAERDDLVAARAAFERTGLTAQQCALVDARPVIQRSNISSNTFPAEALRWGFQGWTGAEFDISADGRTANVRAIVSYPPFVFSPATVKGIQGARYTQSYRPEGGLGCGGQRQAIRFVP